MTLGRAGGADDRILGQRLARVAIGAHCVIDGRSAQIEMNTVGAEFLREHRAAGEQGGNVARLGGADQRLGDHRDIFIAGIGWRRNQQAGDIGNLQHAFDSRQEIAQENGRPKPVRAAWSDRDGRVQGRRLPLLLALIDLDQLVGRRGQIETAGFRGGDCRYSLP